MPQEFQHYQTSFSIASESISEKHLFNKLQSLAFRWVVGKENKRRNQFVGGEFGMQIPAKEFFRKGGGKSRASHFVSDTGYFESGRAWVLEYGHVDSGVKGLFWTTRIGLHQITVESA